VHVGTGWAILTEVGADQATGAPVLVLTTTRVDLTTGEFRAEASAVVHTATDADERERVARELQSNMP